VSNGGGQIVNPTGARRVAAGESLADVLERVLDKGVVIAGDVAIALVGIELLTIKIRLLIASADKAREMGIDWWRSDPFLTGQGADGQGESGDPQLLDRIARLEARLEQSDAPAKTSRRSPRRTRA
jgi:hypothetical protein